MQLKGIRVELKTPNEMAALVKKSIENSERVNTQVNRASVDFGNWALTLKLALKDLEDVRSSAAKLRIQAERAKQKGSADQYRKIESNAADGIAKYGKLAKAIASVDKLL